MKNTNGQKGITLIALVVTIVVLLILAGITITYVINGGIFSTADDAAKATEKAVVEDYAQNGIIDCMSSYYANGTTDAATLGGIMQNNFPTGAFTATPSVTVSAGSVSMTKTTVTIGTKKYDVTITNSKVTVENHTDAGGGGSEEPGA